MPSSLPTEKAPLEVAEALRQRPHVRIVSGAPGKHMPIVPNHHFLPAICFRVRSFDGITALTATLPAGVIL